MQGDATTTANTPVKKEPEYKPEKGVVFGQRTNEIGAQGGGKPSEGDFKKDFPDKKPVPQTTKQKFDKKFIKKDKGVGFVKRGTPGAQRAENKEKNKMRAQEMAKERIAAKKEGTASTPMSGKERAQAMAKARIAAKNAPATKPTANTVTKAAPQAQAKQAAPAQQGNTAPAKQAAQSAIKKFPGSGKEIPQGSKVTQTTSTNDKGQKVTTTSATRSGSEVPLDVKNKIRQRRGLPPVSYTHLTLPTKRIV